MKKSIRNAIISFHRQGWKIQEIASQLKVPYNTVKDVIKANPKVKANGKQD